MKEPKIIKDGWSWIIGAFLVFGIPAFFCFSLNLYLIATILLLFSCIGFFFMLFFFRNPERIVPPGDQNIIAGADGLVRAVEEINEERYLKTKTKRVSIYLSPFDVHVNRAPIAGKVTSLAYVRGKHLLTIRNESSDVNQHSSILIEGKQTKCLVKQITGPIVRRVVYWLKEKQIIDKGELIGMMKFGSRLDMYFPEKDVDIIVKKGDVVKAGITIVGTLKINT